MISVTVDVTVKSPYELETSLSLSWTGNVKGTIKLLKGFTKIMFNANIELHYEGSYNYESVVWKIH